MKKKTAKYGLFGTTGSGADYLITARDSNGKPLMTYEKATERLNDFDERHKMQIRSI